MKTITNGLVDKRITSIIITDGLVLTPKILTTLATIRLRKRSNIGLEYDITILSTIIISPYQHHTINYHTIIPHINCRTVQIEDWLTHYLTQLKGEKPDMVSHHLCLSSLDKVGTQQKKESRLSLWQKSACQLVSCRTAWEYLTIWLYEYLDIWLFDNWKWRMSACPLQATVRELRVEVRRFSKVCHLVWSTWSVIQVIINSQ